MSPVEIQPLDHLAMVTNNGIVVERPVAPELVYPYGADDVRNDLASTEDFRRIGMWGPYPGLSARQGVLNRILEDRFDECRSSTLILP